MAETKRAPPPPRASVKAEGDHHDPFSVACGQFEPSMLGLVWGGMQCKTCGCTKRSHAPSSIVVPNNMFESLMEKDPADRFTGHRGPTNSATIPSNTSPNTPIPSAPIAEAKSSLTSPLQAPDDTRLRSLRHPPPPPNLPLLYRSPTARAPLVSAVSLAFIDADANSPPPPPTTADSREGWAKQLSLCEFQPSSPGPSAELLFLRVYLPQSFGGGHVTLHLSRDRTAADVISLTLTSRRRHTPSTQISEDLLLSVVGAEEALGHEVTLGTLLEAGADRLDLSLRIAGSKNEIEMDMRKVVVRVEMGSDHVTLRQRVDMTLAEFKDAACAALRLRGKEVSSRECLLTFEQQALLDETATLGALVGQLETAHMNLVLRNIEEDRAHWIDDAVTEKCMGCSRKFGGVFRKHHCRLCGKIFCGDCAPKKNKADALGHQKRARYCHSCVPVETQEHQQEPFVCHNRVCGVRFENPFPCSACKSNFCVDCCPLRKRTDEKGDHSPQVDRMCHSCLPAKELEVLFEEHVVTKQLKQHVVQELRAVPIATKRTLLQLHTAEIAKAKLQGNQFVLFEEPIFWMNMLGTEGHPPKRRPLASQLQRLRVMLSAADEKWIEEFVTQVGKGGLVRLLTGDAEPTVQRCALACLHALASTKTGLHAIIADANVAEGVLIMLFLKPQFQVECLDLLALLCWSAPEGRAAVVEGFSLITPKYRYLSKSPTQEFAQITPKYQLLVDLLHEGCKNALPHTNEDEGITVAPSIVNVKLLLAVLLFINVIISTVSSIETENLRTQQDLRAAGLDLGLIAQLEDVCAAAKSLGGEQLEPIYELEVQCMVYRKRYLLGLHLADVKEDQFRLSDESEYWTGILSKLPFDADATRLTRAQLMRNMKSKENFIIATHRHTSLPTLLEGMMRRVPRNELAMTLLKSAVNHRLQHVEYLSRCPPGMQDWFPSADSHAVAELTILFECGNSEAEKLGRWRCECGVEDISVKATNGDNSKNYCRICCYKAFLLEGGLQYLLGWWEKELATPHILPSLSISSTVLWSPIAMATLLANSRDGLASSRHSRQDLLSMLQLFWSFTNLFELDVLKDCPAFQGLTAAAALEPDPKDTRWVAKLVRVSPLSPFRQLSRGALLESLHTSAGVHRQTLTLNSCLLEGFMSLLTTGKVVVNHRGPQSEGVVEMQVPDAVPFVIAICKYVPHQLTACALRTLWVLLHGGATTSVPHMIHGLPFWADSIRLECLRELVSLLSHGGNIALACATNHPEWLESFQSVLLTSNQNEKAGLYEISLLSIVMILHRHMLASATLTRVSFSTMWIDALYAMGLSRNETDTHTTHAWTPRAVEQAKKLLEGFIFYTLKKNLKDWCSNYLHPAWSKFLSFVGLFKRLFFHNVNCPDFLVASQCYGTIEQRSPPAQLVTPVAITTMAQLLRTFNLDSSDDELCSYGTTPEEAKQVVATREEARLLSAFFQLATTTSTTTTITPISLTSISLPPSTPTPLSPITVIPGSPVPLTPASSNSRGSSVDFRLSRLYSPKKGEASPASPRPDG